MKSKNVTGIIKRHPDGFGFLVPDDRDLPDIYITKRSMSGVMANDKVRAEVQREHGGNRLRGNIIEVLERTIKSVTGQFHPMDESKGMLKDESHAWGSDLIVLNDSGHTLTENDWVSVEIVTYPDSAQGFTGKISAVIGDVLDPANDAKRVLYGAEIPIDFPSKAIKEAEVIPEVVTEADCVGRKDLRATPFITIDGVTAKDFDDAIYVEVTKNGFNLKVAIADVSHYVKPDSAIDDEAYKRGNSTYFPNFVSPMLPEKLSNGICSLKPKVDRLAFVCDMELNYQGELVSYKFYEAVINSHARVTYGEAQEVLEGNCPEKFEHVKEHILHGEDLAKLLMARRFRDGSLNLEIAETEIELDETGEIVDILRNERVFSHKLIEEMMLVANIATAKFLTDHQIEGLFRIHEAPDEDNLTKLQGFLEIFGFGKGLRGGKLQKKITKALQSFEGKPEAEVLNILTLRTMKQAQYSPDDLGHFGLGFTHYSHFTSPIRRYPDLIVHRLIKSSVVPGKGYRLKSYDDLETAGAMLSGCEQRSVKAERQFVSIKKARFMLKHLGEEFDGMVTSVAKFGAFVLLRQFDVDGLVRLEELGSDLEFDEENLQLVSRRSGATIKIGDPMKVIVAAADSEMGRIDFVPVGGKKKAARESSSKVPRPKPKGKKQHRKGQSFKGKKSSKSKKSGKGQRSDRSESSGETRDSKKKSKKTRITSGSSKIKIGTRFSNMSSKSKKKKGSKSRKK